MGTDFINIVTNSLKEKFYNFCSNFIYVNFFATFAEKYRSSDAIALVFCRLFEYKIIAKGNVLSEMPSMEIVSKLFFPIGHFRENWTQMR